MASLQEFSLRYLFLHVRAIGLRALHKLGKSSTTESGLQLHSFLSDPETRSC